MNFRIQSEFSNPKEIFKPKVTYVHSLFFEIYYNKVEPALKFLSR